MKEIFCKFFKFFQKPSQQPYREHRQSAQRLHEIGHAVADFDSQTADGEKVDRAAHKQPRRPVQPDISPPGVQGPQKQHGCDRQPEHKIQNAAQQGQADPDAQDAKQVVQHPRGHPQRQRLQHGPALLGHRDGHAQ